MAVVACLLLLLYCSTAGQATPTSSSSFATGWQDGQLDGKAGRAWLYNGRSKTPSALRGTTGPNEMLVKRTSSSSMHRPRFVHPQETGPHPVPHSHTLPSAPPPPQVEELADHSHQADLSTPTPSYVSAVVPSTDGPSAPLNEAGSSSTMHHKVFRRPYGSLKHIPALRAQADRQKHAQRMQSLKDGSLIDKKKPDGSKYAISTIEEFRASKRASARRLKSSRTEEAKAKYHQKKNKSARLLRAKRKAQREAEREGRIWQGSPVRKAGRPRQYPDQGHAAAQEARQLEPTHLAIEEETQPAVDVPHVPPGTHGPAMLRLSKPASLAGSSSLQAFAFPSVVPHHRLTPGPSSPQLDFRLSLAAPGSSTSGQKQTRAPRPVAPPTARTREEDMLRLTIAPPGHDLRSADRNDLDWALQ